MKNLYWFGILATLVILFSTLSAGSVFAQQYNYNNYGRCTYHAYKDCVGNNIYWYDSCANQQDLYYSCGGGLSCQYGQCVVAVQPYYQQVNNYVVQSTTRCYGNSIYWYDSLGVASGLYRSCVDSNSCTIDACSGSTCLNTLKCDGSTCASDSVDYNKYCSTQPAQLSQPIALATISALSVFFSAKPDANSAQWQKTVQVGPNGQVYFMISVVNNSAKPADNVSVAANIPSEISSLGNLKINDAAVSGDIVSGINIGLLVASASKSITFEGKTQGISEASTKQATVAASASGVKQFDSVSINFVAGETPAAAVSSAPASSGFMGFLKRWYLWILGGLVLIFLFVMVFRRLSSNI